VKSAIIENGTNTAFDPHIPAHPLDPRRPFNKPGLGISQLQQLGILN